MASKTRDPEPIRYAVIRSIRQKRTIKEEAWRYWEIIGILQWMGASRQTAYDAGKKIIRAQPGETMMIAPEIYIEIRQQDPEPEGEA